MLELSLDNVNSFLDKEGDYTVRLLNRSAPPPNHYIFALLWFNGNTGLWMARFLNQNLKAVFEESEKGFLRAKQVLIENLKDYLTEGYKITVLQSGYYIPPWLLRKR